MQTRNILFKTLGALMAVAMLLAFLPAGEVAAQTTHTVCLEGTCNFTSIQAAIDAATGGDTIQVAAGMYDEDVNINKSLSLIGADAENTTIVGPIGGLNATMRVSASNVVIDGFSITRAGNNMTDWNDVNLNLAGIAIQGAYTGTLIQNNIIFGNRTGIDINNSSYITVKNNDISDNRTGMLMRNQTDYLTVTGNNITNNWTIGVLFLDASGGSNIPLQQALNSTFSDNVISGNWYGGVEDRQAGGSLPTPGTNLKNFVKNWWGTDMPVVTTDPGGEPGYADLIPVAFGGTAEAPTDAPDVLGVASANIIYNPWYNTDAMTTKTYLVCADQPFTTIQAAIADASAGNTILVCAGTYTGTVNIDKSLTIIGEGDVTEIQGVVYLQASNITLMDLQTRASVRTDALNLSNITLDGVRLKALTPNSGEGFRIKTGDHLTGLTITDSIFENWYDGIIVERTPGAVASTWLENVTVTDTIFQNNYRKGLYIETLNNATFTSVQILNNGKTTDTSTATKHAAGFDLNLKDGDYSNLTFTDMTFEGNGNPNAEYSGAFFIKARADGATYGTYPATLTDVTIEGGSFINNYVGIRVGEPNTTDDGTTGVSITGAHLYGNTNGDVVNNSLAQVNASPNWWGSYCGPSNIAGDILYSPWYTDAAMTTTAEGEIGAYLFPEGATADQMNALIACAPPGSTLIFEGESYPGGIVVGPEKYDLTFELNGATLGAGSPAFTIAGDTITVNGPGTLNGNGIDHAILVQDGAANITINLLEIKNWADGVHYAGAITNTQVVDTYFHLLSGDGIYFTQDPVIQEPVSFYIQGNMFLMETIGKYGVYAPSALDVTYNSWGSETGPANGDLPAAFGTADYTPFTHVDLYLESTNPDIDNWFNQVLVGDTITYQVKANLVNVTGADFLLAYPTDFLSVESFSLVSTAFQGRTISETGTLADVLTHDAVAGTFSFIGDTALPGYGPINADDAVLFEVEFKALQSSPGLVLDLDDTSDVFSMFPVSGTTYGPSENIYAYLLEDFTDLTAIDPPTLDVTGLDEPFYAGMSHEINTTICNPDTGGEWTDSPTEPDAIAFIRITDATLAEIASLQFLYDGVWVDFDFQDNYGGIALQEVDGDILARFGNYNFGFDIPNDAPDTWCDFDAFRVTFVEPGIHEVSMEIYDMMDDFGADGIDEDYILLASYGPVPVEVLGDFDVVGTVSMQGRTVRSGVPFALIDAGLVPLYGPTQATSTSELAYNLRFSGVNGGLYQVTTLQERYLNVHEGLEKVFSVNGATVVNNEVLLDYLELRGGNAFWYDDVAGEYDNTIDLSDAAVVGTGYGGPGATEPTGANHPDVNFDDKVNIQDLALVGGNFNLTSEVAYEDWLLPEYNGAVSGIFTTEIISATEVYLNGMVSGDYNLVINGQVTDDYGEDRILHFNATVTGDIEGTITDGRVLDQGIDPMYAIVEVDGTTETVRIIGNFVQSGIDGHFKGQIITGPELTPLTSLEITGGDSVVVGETITLTATSVPAGRDVLWSVYGSDASIDMKTGELTGLSQGSVVVIAVAVDDSNLSYAKKTISVN